MRRCGRVPSGGCGMSEMAAMSTRWNVPMEVGTLVREKATVECTKVKKVSRTHDDDGVFRRVQ